MSKFEEEKEREEKCILLKSKSSASLLDADCSMQRFTSSPLQFSLVNKKKKATKKLQMSRRDNSAEIEEEKKEILTRE